MLSLGFERCKYDPNVYLQHDGDVFQVILLYFGDIFITINCNKEIGSINSLLHSDFSMTDLGLLKQFLGLEIEQSEKGIKVSQQKYDSYLFFKFNMF